MCCLHAVYMHVQAPARSGSPYLPSELPPLDDALPDAPALEARQVTAGTTLNISHGPEGATPLMALPSLHSNPTLSLSFSRFMAALDDDLRALGGSHALADPQVAPVATASPPPVHHPPADASGMGEGPESTGPDARSPDPVPLARSPRPGSAPRVSAVNHLSAHELSRQVAEEAGTERDRQQAGAPPPQPAGGTLVRLMNVQQDDTDKLELLLSDGPPPIAAAPHRSGGDVKRAVHAVHPRMLPERDPGHPSRGAVSGSPHAEQRAPAECPGSAGGGARAGGLPRISSADEGGPAWLSPRSTATVSAPRRQMPEHAWLAPQQHAGSATLWQDETLLRRSSVEGPAAPLEGVSQAEVHGWINDSYLSSGLMRPLSCLDYQVRIIKNNKQS